MIKYSMKFSMKFFNNLKSLVTTPKKSLNKISFGDKIEIDLKNNRITFKEPFEIVGNGNLKITSGENLILQSSRTDDAARPGYRNSIWLNPDLDQNGNPIEQAFFYDKCGNAVLMEAKYDSNGILLVPEGYNISPIHNDDCGCSNACEEDGDEEDHYPLR